jgi:hypothetical protein
MARRHNARCKDSANAQEHERPAPWDASAVSVYAAGGELELLNDLDAIERPHHRLTCHASQPHDGDLSPPQPVTVITLELIGRFLLPSFRGRYTLARHKDILGINVCVVAYSGTRLHPSTRP